MKTEKRKTLEEMVATLQQKGKNKPLTLEEILETMSGRGTFLTIIFLCLPFCQPIQIPGLSLPFGLVIAFLGIRIAFRKKPWLPKKLKEKQIPTSTWQKIADKVIWVTNKIKKWVYPRMSWLADPPFLQINGILIAILGVTLALPLPIPLSNLLAAWALFCISLGLFEDDGVLIIIGYCFTAITLIFFLATFFLIKAVI